MYSVFRDFHVFRDPFTTSIIRRPTSIDCAAGSHWGLDVGYRHSGNSLPWGEGKPAAAPRKAEAGWLWGGFGWLWRVTIG